MSISLPTSPQNIFQLFKTGGRIWKETLIPTFILYLLLIGFSYLLNIFQYFFPEADFSKNPNPGGGLIITSIILVLITIFFTLSLYSSILFRINNIIKFHDLNLRETLSYGFNRFFPLVGLGIALTLACLILLAPINLGIVGIATLLKSSETYSAVAPYISLLMPIVTCIILFVLVVYFSFAAIFTIFGRGVFESIRESASLIKNQFWRSALTFIAIYLPVLLCFMIVFAILFTVVYVNNVDEKGITQFIKNIPTLKLVLLYIVGYVVVFIPISHYFYSCLLAYFYDLHNRKQIPIIPDPMRFYYGNNR